MTALAILAAVAFIWWFIHNWRKTGRRIDDAIESMRDDPLRTATTCQVIGHIGPMSKYSGYRICLACGERQDQPYDQDLDGTDLGQWNQEMTS